MPRSPWVDGSAARRRRMSHGDRPPATASGRRRRWRRARRSRRVARRSRRPPPRRALALARDRGALLGDAQRSALREALRAARRAPRAPRRAATAARKKSTCSSSASQLVAQRARRTGLGRGRRGVVVASQQLGGRRRTTDRSVSARSATSAASATASSVGELAAPAIGELGGRLAAPPELRQHARQPLARAAVVGLEREHAAQVIDGALEQPVLHEHVRLARGCAPTSRRAAASARTDADAGDRRRPPGPARGPSDRRPAGASARRQRAARRSDADAAAAAAPIARP